MESLPYANYKWNKHPTTTHIKIFDNVRKNYDETERRIQKHIIIALTPNNIN
ncbi:MAG: hypothetical protein JNL63_06395 [Bacteroidia bacterium]|nr:hypothetical protein [Bacteroidia bacterium]